MADKNTKGPENGVGNAGTGTSSGLRTLLPWLPKKKQEAAVTEPVEPGQKVRLLFPSDKPILSKASFFVKIALLVIALVLLVVSVKLLMDYSRMVEEENRKKEYYSDTLEKIDELNYYIDAPMDEYYVRKFAWEIFHMVPADKKVVIVPEK